MKQPASGPAVLRILLGIGVIALFAALGLSRLSSFRVDSAQEGPPPRLFLPAPSGATPAVDPKGEEFVDSRACADCHQPQYQAWAASTHGHAGGPPDRARVIAPFNGVPMRFGDAVVTPRTGNDGRYTFTVTQKGRPEAVYAVDWVVGGGHMQGGGTQAYFGSFPDGTVRFLPFDYSRHSKTWFCQTRDGRGKGWTPVGPALSLSDCSNWPPTRVLGSHSRFSNCQGCHGSQIQLVFDEREKQYKTRFPGLAINCESCHGPGGRHVALTRAGRLGESADIGMRALATVDKDASVEVCLACHAVKRDLRPGYLPGKSLEAHASLKLPLLSSRPLFADGRVRTFAYQEQHLYSDCYLNGSMTCVDCHDPHSQRYRDLLGRPLKGRLDDGQCTGCHPSKLDQQERHTHHKAGLPGSRCVDCHMPYVQEPDVGDHIRYARADHTISIPRPTLDMSLGAKNACQACHAEWSLETVQTRLAEWYGEVKPSKRLVDGVIRGQQERDRSAAAALMLADEGNYPALQFSGLATFSLGHLGPDMDGVDPSIVRRMRELSQSGDLDLKALALASLHMARGEDPRERAFLAQQLTVLGPRDDAIRSRWAWILNFRGEDASRRGDLAAAFVLHRKAQEILPGDPVTHRGLGLALRGQGAADEAIASLRRAHELDPEDPLTLVTLVSALASKSDLEGALAVCERALARNPRDSAAHFARGNIHLKQKELQPAIAAYERALASDPSLAPAHFALGMAHLGLGNREQAVAAFGRGVELDRSSPDSRRVQAMLASLAAPAK